MSAAIIVPLIIFLLILVWMSVYTFDRRYNRTRILTTRAAATSANTAIVYTIPTNPPTSEHGSVPIIPHRSLFGTRPQPYNTTNDMPPSYEDVTKTNTTATT
ncbi:uncharacterized protein LOC119770032 [Culex quinquefasciatus]|uniref:uncharacterized protein LOC119770032 n=1 Tax=Culex quinquefasciatus TaxID=7176 RepID=UPI0018E3706D|nr:uncharacterized protein LOC119770032 [Culex quinquefasciatus]XP_039442373.1 uncharacterized protein LOC120422878 [Culex pipiens pallens]